VGAGAGEPVDGAGDGVLEEVPTPSVVTPLAGLLVVPPDEVPKEPPVCATGSGAGFGALGAGVVLPVPLELPVLPELPMIALLDDWVWMTIGAVGPSASERRVSGVVGCCGAGAGD
jgi:hypothetical protein